MAGFTVVDGYAGGIDLELAVTTFDKGCLVLIAYLSVGTLSSRASCRRAFE